MYCVLLHAHSILIPFCLNTIHSSITGSFVAPLLNDEKALLEAIVLQDKVSIVLIITA